MIGYVIDGGYAMWGVLVCGIVMVTMAARAVRRHDPHAVDAVLIWAGAALSLGLIGTLLGISSVAAAMEAAQQPSPALAWEGLRISLSTTFIGVLLFLIGLVSWGLLRGGRARSPQQ